jgi:glycosyltransferase involved in cell wall biosynthesis
MTDEIPSVTLFRNFAEDHRTSMEIYADGLGQALRARHGAQCKIREYRPRRQLGVGEGRWQMRLARYAEYPWQAFKQQKSPKRTINHVLDHGYGHLLYILDPRCTIVTVHDLIPLVRWRGRIPSVSRGEKPWLNLLSTHALRRAVHLIADSESTRCDLIELGRCDPDKITVVPLGLSPDFRPYVVQDRLYQRSQWGLPVDSFCIFTSGSHFNKNQIGSLEAFARLLRLSSKNFHLVTTAQPTDEWSRALLALVIGNRVKLVKAHSLEQMVGLYNSVDCLLFPSLYEGFGLPPLEAMACGIPVVTSNAASLPEVVGKAALMCDAQDHDGLASALNRLSTDTSLRDSLIEQGLTHARQFTWEAAARKTVEVYEKVAAGLVHSEG